MATITLENLTKYFGNSTAVDRINLDVKGGELITLKWSFWLWQDHDIANACGLYTA